MLYAMQIFDVFSENGVPAFIQHESYMQESGVEHKFQGRCFLSVRQIAVPKLYAHDL